MAMIVILSAKGAPGTTTTVAVLASTWPSRVVVTDCDPLGGDLGVGWLAPWWLDGWLHDRRGLLSFVTATRHEARVAGGILGEHLQDVPGTAQARLLVGLRERSQAMSITDAGWRRLATALVDLSRPGADTVDVLADCGRLGAATPWPLVDSADLVLLAVRPHQRHIASARPAAAVLRERVPADRLGLVVCATSRAAVGPTQRLLGLPAALALPDDPHAARVFSDGVDASGRVWRSALVRVAARTGHRLHLVLNSAPSHVPATPAPEFPAPVGVRR